MTKRTGTGNRRRERREKSGKIIREASRRKRNSTRNIGHEEVGEEDGEEKD